MEEPAISIQDFECFIQGGDYNQTHIWTLGDLNESNQNTPIFLQENQFKNVVR